MKIFIAQQDYIIGNFQANTNKIIQAIKKAKEQGGELIIFSELAVCGYPPRDFLEFEDFINKSLEAIDLIKQEAQDIAVLVGAPSRNQHIEGGKPLFNSAYFLHEGEIKQVINKTLLPNYDVFDEYRYFEPAYDWNVVNFKGKKLAVTICEDIWNFGEHPMYRDSPMEHLMQQNPDIILNLSASPFDYTHADDRLWIVSTNAKKYKLPIIYCNTVGSQTEIVFDGGSIVCDAFGNLVKQLNFFEEQIDCIHWEDNTIQEPIVKHASALPQTEVTPRKLIASMNISLVYQALVIGIREYFQKMGFKQAVIASSGGIDSAVTLALACDALGSENVRAVLMPSQFSTDHSISDAEQLSKNLGNPYETLPIKSIFESFENVLSSDFKDLAFNVAEENIQSRIRGTMVMALANKFNYVLLNTSNKSELATGYGTLYGDMAGGLSVLGDLYKTQVYALARYINKEKEIIPNNILDKAPSAELRPGQKDSDSLPDYNVLDAIVYQYVELRQSPKDIIAQGFDAEMVNRLLKMVNKNEYKRNQFCPIIRISAKAFGIGRRVPIVGKYLD